jgi:tetratricopeptide (TPR) repeat protein
LSVIVAAQPNSWYPAYLRGLVKLLKGDYPAARVDIDRAIMLKPTTNFPYIVALIMAMREGRLIDAAGFLAKIRSEFPDTTFGQLTIEVSMGASAQRDLKTMFVVSGLFFLRRYDQVIKETDQVVGGVITSNPILLSVGYFVRGFSFCNLGDDKKAEDAYSKGIAADPENVSLYLLRADVRRRLQNVLGAAQDIAIAQSKISSNIMPFVEANMRGEFTCKNTFEYLLSATPQR